MKPFINKLSYLFLAFVIVLPSCKDDEDDRNRRDLLIGTWEIQTGELEGYEITIEGVTLNESTIGIFAAASSEVRRVVDAVEEGANILFPPGTTISFNADDSFVIEDETEVTNGTWSLSDNEETITVQATNDLGINQLEFIIRSLTDQAINVSLRIEDDDIDFEDLGEGELPANIEGFAIEYDFNFGKQQ